MSINFFNNYLPLLNKYLPYLMKNSISVNALFLASTQPFALSISSLNNVLKQM
jgi:hypothetical protein